MNPTPNANGVSPEIQAAINAALAAQAQAYESTIIRLETRMANMSLPKPPVAFSTPPKLVKSSSRSQPFNRATSEPAPSRAKNASHVSASPSTSTPSKLKTPSQKTPAKKRPNQAQVEDYPKDFEGTKEGLTVHIKLMWGMLEANSPPPPVDPRSLAVFSDSFSTYQQVELVLKNTVATNLVAEAEILTLKQGRVGAVKLGRGMLYVDEVTIHTIHSHLARLGIYLWGPDLTEAADSLYNSACRLAALKSFREVALNGGVYANVNKSYLNNFTMLTQAYNHFVHYLSAQRFRKEIASPGKLQMCTVRSVILRRRQRLCKARCEFLASQKNVPNRYMKLIAKPSAHSDDEAHPNRRNVYIIKTLRYRSVNMNKFIRRLDITMQKAEKVAGITSQRHPRVLPKVPKYSDFTAPPTQLPIDFYSPAWFNDLPPGQKDKVADSRTVALLPNAAESFLSIPHPAEKLSGAKFNKKYYDRLIKPYQLLVASESDDETLERRGDVDVRQDLPDDEGEGIDLQVPSDGEDADDDEYYLEGEFGDLYDQEEPGKSWIVSDSEDSEEDNSEFAIETKEGGEEGIIEDEELVDRDGDYTMKKGKGKGKAD